MRIKSKSIMSTPEDQLRQWQCRQKTKDFFHSVVCGTRELETTEASISGERG